MRKILFIIFFLCCPSLFSFPVSMYQDWKVSFGKNLDYSSSNENWQGIRSLTFRPNLLKNLPQTTIMSFTLYKDFELTKSDLESLDKEVGIYFPFITNVYEAYLNGVKIDSRGKVDSEKVIENGTMAGYILHLPRRLLKEGKNELYIFLAGWRGEEIALYGDEDTRIDYVKTHQEEHSEIIEFILLSLYIFTGLYHLLLFWKRPKEKYNLYYGLFAVLIGSYLFFRTNYIFRFQIEYLLQYKLELLLLFATASTMFMFFESFLGVTHPKVVLIYNLLLAILGLVVIVSDRAIATTALKVFQITAFLALGFVNYFMIIAIKKKHPEARSLLFGFIVLVFTIIADLIGAMNIIPNYENHNFTRYGFFSFVMGIAVVLANRFLRVHKEVEDLNENLEKKVKERTKQLAESLEKVENLKKQQDGDYFLTSLLIKPLMRNEAKSDRVKIEFFIRQKKQFEFRNKIHEIGGDICISNNISIKGKKYLAFVNADAMGKSIQGAGGALVLGVVFRSVITRTQQLGENRYPEQWLKSCFIELQNVFVSFDGSMLISVVMGLVEEDNGMVYFINAEHPWVVLYRDGKASFIEDSLTLRKIGMTGLDGTLSVKTYQLHKGDSLILGSDGRDDILLNYLESGQRVINEDETLFLKHVEKGKGDLEKITQAIQETGELTDDYTLLKITYLGEEEAIDVYSQEKFYELVTKANHAYENKDFKTALVFYEEAYQIHSRDKNVLQKLIHLYFGSKDYEKTILYCKEYLQLEPRDTDYLFILSACFKLNNQIQDAIDLGEALRLREPHNVKNLINLADSYRIARNYSRAEKILSYALAIEENNEKALKLKHLLLKEYES